LTRNASDPEQRLANAIDPGLDPRLVLILGGSISGSNAVAATAPAFAAASTPAMTETSRDPWSGLHRSELRIIERIQSVHGLAGTMRVVSDLGPGRYLILALAAILFCFQPRLALRMTLLMFVALWLREILALWLQSPRPYWYGAPITTWGTVAATRHTFGLPSGHALVGSAVWMFAAAETRRRWAMALAVVVSLAIAVSRVYLGVHFLTDVALGLVLGYGLFRAWSRLETGFAMGWLNVGPGTRHVAAWGIGLAMATLGGLSCLRLAAAAPPVGWEVFVRSAINPETTVAQGGAVTGILLSVAMLGRWIEPMGPWWLRVIRLGLAGAVLRYGVEPVGDWIVDRVGESPGSLVRLPLVFAVAGFKAWVVWCFFPWLYLKLGQSRAMPWNRVQRKIGSLLRAQTRD
jgi:hypothetical protein